jgi:vanillate O-demethylase ferredoxin subunit
MASSHTLVWQRATVMDRRHLTPRIMRIVVRPQQPVSAPPGSHVDVRLQIDGETVTRSYSIAESEAGGAMLAISVFESEVSRGGAKVMHALTSGDVIEMTQPLQDFPLRMGASSYTLLAGGVGVTAILGMAAALAASGDEYRVVYCGRARTHMAYLDELIQAHGERVQMHVREEDTSLDVEALIGGLPEDGELYMCGPIRLMDAVRRAWVARGLPPSRLRFETFGNSGWFAPEDFTVRVPALGLEVAVPPSSTLLEALEAAGADALFDCRKGECGLCEARVIGLDGVIDHRDVFYSERQRDTSSRICVCVSRVCGTAGGHAEISLELS